MDPRPADSAAVREAFNPDEQPIDQLVEQAAAAVAKGENAEQVLEAMQIMLPASDKEKAKKKFIAALAKRGLRQPSGEPDVPSRRTLARIRAALTISTRLLVERITMMVRLRPDIAVQVKQAGAILLRNGVAIDRVAVSEADLGTLPPSVTTAVGADRGTSRG